MTCNVKFEHEFTGFEWAYTIITANNLPYPFIAPSSSLSGFTMEEWPNDKQALEYRTYTVKLEKSYANEDKFPFTQDEFANMMLSMYEYQPAYVEFKEPYDVNEFTPQKTI